MRRIWKLLTSILFIVLIASCVSEPAKTTEQDSNRNEGVSNMENYSTLAANTETEGQVEMRVLWTVSNYILEENYFGDENTAKGMLFKELDINDTQIIFNNQVCDNVSFIKRTMNTSEYLKNTWNISPQYLGIEYEKLEVITTNCNLFGFKEYIRLGDGRLVVPFERVFYFFSPVRN